MFSNLVLLAVVVFSVALQITIHHLPFTQRMFDIGAIPLEECLMSLGIGLVPVTLLELSKLAKRVFSHTQAQTPVSGKSI